MLLWHNIIKYNVCFSNWKSRLMQLIILTCCRFQIGLHCGSVANKTTVSSCLEPANQSSQQGEVLSMGTALPESRMRRMWEEPAAVNPVALPSTAGQPNQMCNPVKFILEMTGRQMSEAVGE